MAHADPEHLNLASIGILGGTGLYDIEGLGNVREARVQTPFGEPSDLYVIGTLEGHHVAFLSRHGRGHRLLPSEINYRANIYGFKKLGVERIISVNSVGSLREDIRPRDFVLADQFVDRTRRRPGTFFGDGLVAHIGFADPTCPALSRALHDAAVGLGITSRLGGTYVCIEGPSFSTRAESRIYRSWGCDVVGMTAATEARLSREAEICYATMNLVTDYDVWREGEEAVSVELIMGNMAHNIANAKAVVRRAVAGLDTAAEAACICHKALENTIVTRPELIPAETRARLRLLVGKYLKD
jgi:5'-methylthioadenosine phosphorylase